MKQTFSNKLDLNQCFSRADALRCHHDMVDEIVTVDVREDIAKGHEPFGKIMKAVGDLRDEQQLRLLAPFEPVPLFGILAAQGFSHEVRQTTSGDWEVLFSRTRETKLTSASSRACSQSPSIWPACGSQPTEVVELDTRGLEPPQPLVAILETLSDLRDGAELQARTSRRPMHLYPALEERSYAGRTEEQPDGSFITFIRRA